MLTARKVWQQVSLSLIGDEPSVEIGYPESEFLSHLSRVVSDFLRRTGVCARMDGVHAETPRASYQVPPGISDLKHVLYDQVFLAQSESVTLDVMDRAWRQATGRPVVWAEDSTQPRNFLVYPAPSSSGEEVSSDVMIGTIGYGTDLFNPDGAFYGVISEIVPSGAEAIAAGPVLGTLGSVCWGRRNLLVIGVACPFADFGSIEDAIPEIPEMFASYLAFGCLSLLYSGAGEMRDPARAAYCRARYEEGVELARTIGREYSSAISQ